MTSDWARTMTLSTQPRQCKSGLGAQPYPRFELKHQCPTNLTELERFYREERQKIPKSRRAKRFALFPKRL